MLKSVKKIMWEKRSENNIYRKGLLLSTAYGNGLWMAGDDVTDVGESSQKSPSLSKKLQNISSMKLLLENKESVYKPSTEEKKQTLD